MHWTERQHAGTLTRQRHISMGRKTLAPLRKVIGAEAVSIEVGGEGRSVEVQRERLECGHLIAIKQDAFGSTNACRRRCFQCMRQQAEHDQAAADETGAHQ